MNCQSKHQLRQWCVYMVRCADGSLYTGSTNDLVARVEKHNRGEGAKYTRSRKPVQLIYSEPAADQSAALKREAVIKSFSKRQKTDLIEDDVN